MQLKRIGLAALVVVFSLAAWGRSVSVDLRAPSPAETVGGMQMKAKLAKSSANEAVDGVLRRENLHAGAADVGDVAVGDRLEFALFDDVAVTLTLLKKMPSPLGGDAFLAEASGYSGVKNAVVLRNTYGLTVDMQDYLRRKVYKIISSATGVTVQELEAKGGKCGCETCVPPKQAMVAPKKLRKLKSSDAAAMSTKSGETYIDILVAYDKNAATWARSNGGGVTNFAQMAVQKMNTALSNNELDSKFLFRLVGIAQVSVSTDNLKVALDAATEGSSGWESIGNMRDEVGADIVTVLIDTGSADGTTGLGWSLTSDFFMYDYATFSEMAYNVCSIRSVAQSHTMTHEVGHNMGCGHSDIQKTEPGPQLFSYSSGYYFSVGTQKYHTIMAYGTDGPGGAEVPYFSSPHQTYRGVAVGDFLHNNRETLIDTYKAASKWRVGDASSYVWETAPSGEGDGCVITSVSPAPTGHLSIPAEIGGKTVVGIGGWVFQYCASLRSVTIPDGVTYIGERAFQHCHVLRGISIPDSVTSIGDSAFYACGSLVLAVIPDGVTAIAPGLFEGCTNLASVTIPNSVKSIGSLAFSDCIGLTDLAIPASVKDIDRGAFSGCTGLLRLDVDEKNPSYSIVNGLLCNKEVTSIVACPAGLTSVTVPDGIAYIDLDAFAGCANLGSVELPLSVRFINGAQPFYRCSRLTSIIVHDDNPSYASIDGVVYNKAGTELVACPPGKDGLVVPEGVVSIGFCACRGCGLGSVSLPSTLEYIDQSAFTSCVNLHEIELPDGVRSIGYGAFWGCSLISRIYIPASVRYLGGWDGEEGGFDASTVNAASPVIDVDENNLFYLSIDGVLYDKDKTILFRCPAGHTEISIPGSVTRIAPDAFMNCLKLTEVEIPAGVTEIGEGAFSATGIKSLRFPYGAVSISGDFSCNQALETLVIPSGAHFEGALNFRSCSSLRTVYLPEEMKGQYAASDFISAGASDAMRIIWYSGDYPELPPTPTPSPTPTPTPTPTPVPVQDGPCGGMVDMAFTGAQTVISALYDAKGSLAGTVQLKFGRMGKKGVKVSASATMLIGGKAKKVGAKAVTLTPNGDGRFIKAALPVAFKAPIGSMAFDLAADGTFTLKNGAYEMVGAIESGATGRHALPVGGELPGGTLHFNVDIDALPNFGAGMKVVEAALPDDVPVAVSGTKWTVAKALSLKYQKIKEDGSVRYELPIPDGNVSGLKLKYTAKTGQFKGSFKLYATDADGGASASGHDNGGSAAFGRKPKLKKYTVNVIGFVVDGVGTGEARCKKLAAGPWPVTVE